MADRCRNRPLLLGHRGSRARKTIRENTFSSFDQALADGCDGFEFDVRVTSDGVAVVCHDPKFEGIEIASVGSSEMQSLPRLADVLVRYRERAFLDIELKVGGVEKNAVALIKQASPSCGFVVSSFLPEVLHAMRAVDPEVPLGLICETRAELVLWSQVPVQYVIPHHKLLDLVLMRELKGAGKKVFVWTVNAASDMRRFQDLDVEGIISDHTRMLCETLGGG